MKMYDTHVCLINYCIFIRK